MLIAKSSAPRKGSDSACNKREADEETSTNEATNTYKTSRHIQDEPPFRARGWPPPWIARAA